MGAAKSIYNPACEEAIEFLRMLYGNRLSEKPKEKSERTDDHDRNEKCFMWTFIGMTDGPSSKELQYSVGIRSYLTLEKYIYDDKAVFITPNQFISRTKRTEVMQEWLNAVVVDFDDTQNVADALERMKLPGRATPTLVNKTTKGLHFWYLFDKPVKATLGNQGRYKTIARAMALTAGADLQCPSPTQFFRIPRNIQLSQPNARVSFTKLYKWALAALKLHRDKTVVMGSPEQLMKSEAFTKLLTGVVEGGRNTAAYSMAMVFRNAIVEKNEALETLYSWNERNDPPLSRKAIKDVVECIYKKKADKRLPLNNIKMLSGCKFKFGRIITQKKERSERKRSHYSEWLSDLTQFIEATPERCWKGSQKALAEASGIPLRSLKDVLSLVKDGGTALQVHTEGTGCKAKTVVSYSVPQVVPQNDEVDNFVPQKSEFVPQKAPKMAARHYFVPQTESKKGKIIKFVVQKSKVVPQSESKKREINKVVPQIIEFVPQGNQGGNKKMKSRGSVANGEFEMGQSRIKVPRLVGGSIHPRRGYLSRGVVVCRTRRGLSPQPCT